MRRTLLTCITVLALPWMAQSDPARTAPQVIDALHASLLDVMKQATELGYEGRARTLTPVIIESFDIPFMARTSIGRHWEQASEEERKRFVETFTRFMVANYAGQFDGYSGQHFETLGEEPAIKETLVVKSRLVNPGDEDVQLNYRMRQVGDKWKILDVYLDGTVSELALRRSEFSSIVRRENFDALIEAIDAKIAKLASGSDAS
ncbi:MAG: ABC transporter substrate-binding protein [Myxococcales bacterium]|nr:ABC transporter substrate-binding protein [Myxococcales bacterium]MDH5306325.1 ABC transporter substrate-binding protein [Myxococcales bacterium]MDH5567163.1 ABC transporter substrate-binding protein [Myxococcales bacterium]